MALPDRHWHDRALFGLHFDLHAKRWEREHGATLQLEALGQLLDAVRPDFVQCDAKGHDGLTTWPTRVGTSAPDLAADSVAIYRQATAERGIPLVVHYSGVWDDEAIISHPEWAVVGPDGVRSTAATSFTSRYAEDLMIPQLLELVEAGVDGAWVDGENWASRPDWSAATQTAFRIETGFRGDVPTARGQRGWLEWLEFNRTLFRRHIARYRAAVRERAPEVTVVSNWANTLRMPDPMGADRPDYISGDFAPTFGLEDALPEAAFLDSRGVPWDLMIWSFTSVARSRNSWAMKEPEHLAQEAGLILARGGAVALYDQPARLGGPFAWHTPLLAGLAEFTRAHGALEPGVSAADTLVFMNPAEHWRQLDELFAYTGVIESARGAAYALADLHRPFDLATLDDDLDWSAYTTIVLPEQGDLSGHVERLTDWVRAGGHLVVTGADESRLGSELLGVEFGERIDHEWTHLETARVRTVPVPGPWRPVRASGAEVLLVAAEEDFDPGQSNAAAAAPAVARARVGEGAVTSTALALFEAFRASRYPELRRTLGDLLAPPTEVAVLETDAPSWIWMSLRRNATGTVLHLVNTNSGRPLSPSAPSVGEIPVVADFSVRLRGARPVDVAVAPSGDPLDWDHADGVTTLRISGLHLHRALQLRAE
jgi:hypothetical protein